MSHIGKIGRLPREVREQLNRRLLDGESGVKLVAWLNALPQVKAVLAAEFGGRAINDQNLSAWHQGGYRDWLAQRERMELARQMCDDAGELQETADGHLSDKMAACLAVETVALTKTLADAEEEPARKLKLLRRANRDVVDWRRGDHRAERLRIEKEQQAFQQEYAIKKLAQTFWDWLRRPEVRRVILDKDTTPLKMEELVRLMFGGRPEEPTGPFAAEPQHTGLPGNGDVQGDSR